MRILILIIFCLIIFVFLKRIKNFSKKNTRLLNFKKSLTCKLAPIEKFNSRNEEKANTNPEINLSIGIHDNERQISRKANIHRARLAKFKKSKLNGELIFKDSNGDLYKIVEGEKLFLD